MLFRSRSFWQHIAQRNQNDRGDHRPRIGSLRPLDFLRDGRRVVPPHVIPHRHQHATNQAKPGYRGCCVGICEGTRFERRQKDNQRKRELIKDFVPTEMRSTFEEFAGMQGGKVCEGLKKKEIVYWRFVLKRI